MNKTDLLLIVVFGFQLFTLWHIRKWLLDIHSHVYRDEKMEQTNFFHTFLSAYKEDGEDDEDAE